MDNSSTRPVSPTAGEIFATFLKIGALAFGGVYSMLAFFERELVDRRGWLSHDEFAEAVSIGQMTPGPPIINTGVFIGYSLRGRSGALAATAGLVLPGFFIVIALGYFYLEYKDVKVVGSALKGVAAGVVGLLVSVVYRISSAVIKRPADMAVAVAAFALLVFAMANPIALIAGSGLFGYAVYGRGRAGRP